MVNAELYLVVVMIFFCGAALDWRGGITSDEQLFQKDMATSHILVGRGVYRAPCEIYF